MLVFLERALNLNLSRHPDVSHASHNDVMLSIFDVKLGPLMYLLCVCVNLPFLPWGDGRFGGMVFNCAREFELLHDEANVLFQFYIERLAKDKEWTGEHMSQQGARELFLAMVRSERLRRKMNRVGMCRFYQLIVELKDFMKDWHSFLLMVTEVCLEEKWVDHRVRKDILGKMIDSAADLPHGAGEDAAAQTRKSSADELKQLRAVCRNAFQLCGQTLSDPVVHARAVIISELPQPSHQWYALQAHVLRAVEDGAVWFRSQICGDFWGHLREKFRQLRSPAILEKLGIHLHDNELPQHLQATRVCLRCQTRISLP